MKESVGVILLAAGKGRRAGFEKNKLLRSFLGIPVLERTLTAFLFDGIDEIVVTASETDFDEISALCSKYENVKVVSGGDTRTLSVYNALKHFKSEIVLVHDGARPFISRDLIQRCIACVREHDSGICAVPSTDTLALSSDGFIEGYTNRKASFRIQTPQGFYTQDLLSAYERAVALGKTDYTDDSSLYAEFIGKPKICEGEQKNVKLTYAEDFRSSFARVGFGVDTHAFGKNQNFILLGGVKIPSASGLIAHSDGDVLVHAVMDALLSASGLKDIGHYFPDSDEKWKNADSMDMLAEVLRIVRHEGLTPVNLSVAIQAEKPRLSGYIDQIKTSLSVALGIPTYAVGISAGTNEGLGYVGEGKGITVHATVLME